MKQHKDTVKKKQQQQRHKTNNDETRHTFLHAAEEIASRFGFDAAVAELESAFRKHHQPGFPGGGHVPIGPSRRPVRVAYQGVVGSYCQEAAAALSSSPTLMIPCAAGMEEAFVALEDRSADAAVVTAENSLDGPVHRNLDLLLRHPDIRIRGELVLPVNHCLLALHGSLHRVVSHPQAISHCRSKLSDLDVEVEEVPCAADAARFVAERRLAGTAVIGSRIAAREFGLRILDHSFQDPEPNYNRYLQLGLGPVYGLKPDHTSYKTTVAFSLDKGPSDLFKALWAFESRGVRVTRVDHRPNQSRPIRFENEHNGNASPVAHFDYVFIIDLNGNEFDLSLSRALDRLTEIAGFVRVLGSYPST